MMAMKFGHTPAETGGHAAAGFFVLASGAASMLGP
jgi:hypothetical protein